MRDRLQKFMEIEKLTSSRLAEILGVQPSNISHILGGRNKPSFEFIEKILLRFPKVNPDWLLLGKGSVYRPDLDPQPAPPVTFQSAPSLFSKQEFAPIAEMLSQEMESAPSQQAAIASKTDNDSDTKEKPSENRNISSDKKSESDIERIVVFFRDRSFICYRPK